MSLATGVRLGPYEITARVGAGGMGEVYRAHDSRLGRDVAIKVLPADFSADPERLQRFEQEARAAAALNHPNILAVHDIGQHDGAPYIVSELLEGETVRERLNAGAIPVRKAVEHAIQIAHGLAAAHDKGIVHRDLKPENVFVTADGRVKILDFGLAKLTQSEPAMARLSALPTTPPNTTPGVVLGTIGYMSPEQVRGPQADHRSDIFAFGTVLYEMLSGQRVFRGETTADAMSAILKEEPSALATITHNISPGLERIVARCLEKAPAARFKSADDLAFALEGLSSHSDVSTPAIGGARSLRREQLAWAVATLFGLAAIAFGTAYLTRPPSEVAASELRVQIVTLPDDGGLAALAVSPDGAALVFRAEGRLWLRRLDSETAQPLAGTEGAAAIPPSWSPDGRSLAFGSDGLKRIDLDTGVVRTLVGGSTGLFIGSTWNADGTILFTPAPSTPIMRISAGGGEVTEATRLDPPRQIAHRFPHFLPDGRHFLFLASGPLENRGVYVGSLDSTETHRLFEADSPATFLPPDFLVFVRGGALLAQRLDLDTWQTRGEPTPIAQNVAIAPGTFNAVAVSTSSNGLIAYRANAAERQFYWVDRSGRQIGAVGAADLAQPIALAGSRALSPDDRTLALTRTVDGNTDIWLLDVDVERGVSRRFTSEPVRERSPIWSPDGGRLAFASERSGVFDLFVRDVDRAGSERTLLASSDAKTLQDWSSDGRFILYGVQDPTTSGDLWALPLSGEQAERDPLPVARTPFTVGAGRFSPDGHWVAYSSDETGQGELYVQSFPEPRRRIQLPRVLLRGQTNLIFWRQDGRELFYLGAGAEVMALPLKFTETTVQSGDPVRLFTAPPGGFVAAHDGQRFLVSRVTADPAPITLVLNWAGLRK